MRKVGFSVIRTKGSHHFIRHSDGRSTVDPIHSGETLGPGILASILRDVKLSRQELQDLLLIATAQESNIRWSGHANGLRWMSEGNRRCG